MQRQSEQWVVRQPGVDLVTGRRRPRQLAMFDTEHEADAAAARIGSGMLLEACLVKYAMHCARLGFQSRERLSTGKLELPIQGEPSEWLRAVRYGRVAFDEWWERSLELDSQLEAIGHDQSIRPTADRLSIDTWCIGTHQRTWAGDAR